MIDHAASYDPGTHPSLPPPRLEVGLGGWIYKNLFSGWFNSILTVLSAGVVAYLLYHFVPWLFLDAYWRGDTRAACPAAGAREGACWVFIKFWLKQLMYGRYPNEELWRINSSYVLLAGGLLALVLPTPTRVLSVAATRPRRIAGGVLVLLLIAALALHLPSWFVYGFFWAAVAVFAGWGLLLLVGYPLIALLVFVVNLFGHPHLPVPSLGWGLFLAAMLALIGVSAFGSRVFTRFHYKVWLGFGMLFGFPIIAFHLFRGRSFGLPGVETPLWGGLFLTLIIGVTGIVASLPMGTVLALGRRSKMPVVKSLSVAFIELWRGVPLITVLFMSSVMFPLFMPEGVNFNKLLRALVGVMLFNAAYMAEVVRGGLQAIPKGQYEAADALGLSYWKSMCLIILPQALKIVIPGIINTFIGLFKDTTLVLIIGLFDFLGIVQAVGTNPHWLGFDREGYVFVAFGFWCFCFGMSRYSQFLERKLHTGHRR